MRINDVGAECAQALRIRFNRARICAISGESNCAVNNRVGQSNCWAKLSSWVPPEHHGRRRALIERAEISSGPGVCRIVLRLRGWQ